MHCFQHWHYSRIMHSMLGETKRADLKNLGRLANAKPKLCESFTNIFMQD